MTRLNGNVHVAGTLSATAMTVSANSVTDASIPESAGIQRSKLRQYELESFPIPLTALQVHDALGTFLPSTSANDDLGLYGGTFGTDAPIVKTYDVKAADEVTLYARVVRSLPVEYEAGESVSIRVHAGMVGTVADTSATVDVEVYKSDGAGAVDGSDLSATAAQSINSLTFANKDFSVTADSLAPGDVLDIRLKVVVNDAETASAVAAAIGKLELLCDTRG